MCDLNVFVKGTKQVQTTSTIDRYAWGKGRVGSGIIAVIGSPKYVLAGATLTWTGKSPRQKTSISDGVRKGRLKSWAPLRKFSWSPTFCVKHRGISSRCWSCVSSIRERDMFSCCRVLGPLQLARWKITLGPHGRSAHLRQYSAPPATDGSCLWQQLGEQPPQRSLWHEWVFIFLWFYSFEVAFYAFFYIGASIEFWATGVGINDDD